MEDHPDSRQSLLLLLDLCGFKGAGAGNGREGVRWALSFQPHAAVVDINLPVLDGFEVARRVRAALGKDGLLVALTAHDNAEVLRRARKASFNFHMKKPADPERLLRLLTGGPPGSGAAIALRPN